MEFQLPDFWPAAAEIVLAAFGMLILLVGSFLKECSKPFAYWMTQLALLLAAVLSPFGELLRALVNVPALPEGVGAFFAWVVGGALGFAVLFWARRLSTSRAVVWAPFVLIGALGVVIAGWLFRNPDVAQLIGHLISGWSVRLSFNFSYFADPIGGLLKAVACFTVMAGLFYGRRYMADRRLESMEYYLLALFAVLGMMVLISAGSLLTVYLGLELLSLSSYALVAIDRDAPRSTEAAMKYFVLGALASGLLLYGISMVYGASGTLNIVQIVGALYEQDVNRVVMLFGLVFVVAGIAFKLGVFPFHMWIPDVYHGAPTAVTALISTAPYLAAFAMAYRVLALGMWSLSEHWQQMLMIGAVGSIVLGNLAAIAQSNIKRMLAYSGISHMGFMLLGLIAADDTQNAFNAYASAMFYVVSYALTTLASFGILAVMSRERFEAENIDDLKGMNQRSPWWAAMMAILMFSAAGIPFFVGFFSKFFVLRAVIANGQIWLAVVAVLMSLVGAYYYLRVVKVMYFDEPDSMEAPVAASPGVCFTLSSNVLAVALLGLAPGWLFALCVLVVRATFG